uniref:Uncharacterized protein n=1 Tax=Panagrolaimus sp. ES5 TaxID=591445 RepID=A0AC34GK38_9BILA
GGDDSRVNAWDAGTYERAHAF